MFQNLTAVYENFKNIKTRINIAMSFSLLALKFNLINQKKKNEIHVMTFFLLNVMCSRDNSNKQNFQRNILINIYKKMIYIYERNFNL